MSTEQLRIGGTAARRRTGPAARQVGLTLAAWRREGILAGDEHAGTRAALRDAAEALDATRAALRAAQAAAGDSTSAADDVSRCANRHGECSRRLLDMLASAVPDGGGESGGTLAALIAGGGPTVRD